MRALADRLTPERDRFFAALTPDEQTILTGLLVKLYRAHTTESEER